MIPFVTIIVPTYKREQVLIETLDSLAGLTYGSEYYEVLVVDQTIDHETITIERLERGEKRGEFHWFRAPEIDFASLTRARNFGMAHASKKTEIYLFVDDDVEVQPDFVDQHVALYEDPLVGAVAGKIIVPGHTYPAPPYRVGKISWWGGFINNFHGDEACETDNFVGCNFSLRAKLIKKTGLFDEEFVGNAMREDTDMATRVREAGYAIWYEPKAGLIHKMSASGGTRAEARIAWYQSFFHNNFLFYGKHAGSWRMSFFILSYWRPMLACWIYYGKLRPSAFMAPIKGIVSGLKAAKRSRKSEFASVQHVVTHTF